MGLECGCGLFVAVGGEVVEDDRSARGELWNQTRKPPLRWVSE